MPYRDYFDHHTPLWHLLAAPFAALVDPTRVESALAFLVGARFAGLALSAALVAATWALAHRLAGPRPAAIAAVLLAGEAMFLLKAIEIRPDQLGALALLAATYALARAAAAPASALAPIGARWALAAGIAFGIALLATQKAICAAPGLALGMALLTGPRFPRLAAAATAGALLAALPVLAWFAAHDSLPALFTHTVTANLHWTRAFEHRVWDHATRILTHDTLLAALTASGIALILWHKHRDALALLILPTLASLAIGAVALPVVQEQYFLLAMPFAAICAGWALSQLLAQLPGSDRSPLRRPILLGLALLLLAGTARNLHTAFHRTDAETRLRLAWLFATVPPDATVMAGWTPGIAFRRPAWFHYCLHEEIIAGITPDAWHALAAGLASGTIRPAAIDLDAALAGLPAPVLAEIHRQYAPSGPGNLLLRRAVVLPGQDPR